MKKVTIFGKEFTVRINLTLEKDGEEVVDCELINLLLMIDKTGSILSAAKNLNIPYSRAWEKISKAERLLNVKLVESKRGGRGGGGTKLTSEARELIEKYFEICKRASIKISKDSLSKHEVPDLVYIGSNDPLVEIIAGILHDEGLDVSVSWTGSSIGLAALALGEADVSGIHILDQETGSYNIPILDRHWRGQGLVLVRGYLREIGFVTRVELSYEDIVDGILRGNLIVVNRQPGAGARILFETIIIQECKKRGIDVNKVFQNIKGFSNVVDTHLDVAKAVASGEADVGICIRWAAEYYKLNFVRVRWENFDFVTTIENLNKDSVRKFIEVLKSSTFKEKMKEFVGYLAPADMGEIVWIDKQ